MITRALLPIAMVAAGALAAVCGTGQPTTSRYSQDVDSTCAPYVDTLPTAIPTEQWTPEWLSEWSSEHQEARRKYEVENIDRFVHARGSAADLPRTETTPDYAGSTLDDALQRTDRIVSGTVIDQWLFGEVERRLRSGLAHQDSGWGYKRRPSGRGERQVRQRADCRLTS